MDYLNLKRNHILVNNFPKISVLMPVYNTEETYLREAIESILNQSFPDFELLIFNDGSTNNVKETVLSYTDIRIRYYEHDNQGIAKTTNKLFELAKGAYIALADSDDIFDLNRLQIENSYLDNHPEIGIVSSSYDSFPGTFSYLIDFEKEIHYFDLIKFNCIPNVCAMFRASIIKEYNIRYDESFDCVQDYEFWAKAIRYARVVLLPDVLCHYRILNNSNSHLDETKVNAFVKKVQYSMIDFLTDNNNEKLKLEKIFNLDRGNKKSFLEKIFSIKNTFDKKSKVITILGGHFKI